MKRSFLAMLLIFCFGIAMVGCSCCPQKVVEETPAPAYQPPPPPPAPVYQPPPPPKIERN